MHEVPLRLTGLATLDPEVLQFLDDELEGFAVSGDKTDAVLSVYPEADEASLPTWVADLAEMLEEELDGVRVVDVDPDLVGAPEIARRVGLSRQAVHKWTEKPGFPLPVSQTDRESKRWAWSDIAGWLLEHRGMDMDDRVVSSDVRAEINRALAARGKSRSTRPFVAPVARRTRVRYARSPRIAYMTRAGQGTGQAAGVARRSSTDYVLAV